MKNQVFFRKSHILQIIGTKEIIHKKLFINKMLSFASRIFIYYKYTKYISDIYSINSKIKIAYLRLRLRFYALRYNIKDKNMLACSDIYISEISLKYCVGLFN